MKKETIIGIFLAIMTIWAIGFTAPKLYQIYKDKQTTETIKTDTIIKSDTVYFETIKTDTMPHTKYVTVTQRDTVYRVVGDSIEKTPRQIVSKKKLLVAPLQWKDKILWSTRLM